MPSSIYSKIMLNIPSTYTENPIGQQGDFASNIKHNLEALARKENLSYLSTLVLHLNLVHIFHTVLRILM